MMTSDERRRILMRTILEVLGNLSGYQQPQRALFAAVRLAVYPEPQEAELREVLARLENDGCVHRDDGSLDGVRWSITGIGRARLAD